MKLKQVEDKRRRQNREDQATKQQYGIDGYSFLQNIDIFNAIFFFFVPV